GIALPGAFSTPRSAACAEGVGSRLETRRLDEDRSARLCEGRRELSQGRYPADTKLRHGRPVGCGRLSQGAIRQEQPYPGPGFRSTRSHRPLEVRTSRLGVCADLAESMREEAAR